MSVLLTSFHLYFIIKIENRQAKFENEKGGSAMTCPICTHPHRREIEDDLMCRQWGTSGVTLESIAEKFGVEARDLQVHALMHLPVQQLSNESMSIAQKVNVAEADVLRKTIYNYYITLQNLGMRINADIADRESSMRSINKGVVDLYLGAGAEIRNATDSLVKMNQAVNGENNSGMEAFAGLVAAIRGDKQ